MTRTSRTTLALVLAVCVAVPSLTARADTVYLKNGRVIHTSDARIDGDRVVIVLYGSTQSIPLSLVDRVEEDDRNGPGESARVAPPPSSGVSAGPVVGTTTPGSAAVAGAGTPAERMQALTSLLQQNGAGSAEATNALQLLQSLGGSAGSSPGDLASQLGSLGSLGALGGGLGGLGKDLEQAQTLLPLLAQLGAALFAPEFSPDANAVAVQNLLSGLRSMGISQEQIEAEARRFGVPPEVLQQLRRR